MNTSDVGQLSSPCDYCLTGIAIIALLGQGSWSLAKRSAHEGWLTCKTGAHGAYRAVHHIYDTTTHLLECISIIATYALKEIQNIFCILEKETMRTLISMDEGLQSAAEYAVWIIAPLFEVEATCVSGAHMTKKAIKGTWQGCANIANLFYSVTAPLGQEACQTLVSGMEVCPRIGRSLHRVYRNGADISQAALEGITYELINLFIKALKTSSQTGYAVQKSIQSWLSISKESGYRLLLEAATTCEIGYDECLRACASLPPALQAFLQIPMDGIAALLQESSDTLKIGSNTIRATFYGVYEAASAGIDLLKATLLASLHESIHTGKTGLKISEQTALAIAQAIDHGTEEMRTKLLSLLFESWATITIGARSAPRTVYAVQKGVTHGGGLVALSTIALLQESTAMFSIGSKTGIKAMSGTVQAINEATSSLRNLAYRSNAEVFHSLWILNNQTRAWLHDFKNSVQESLFIAGDGLVKSAHEVNIVACKGLQEVTRFDYQMSHELSRSLSVYVFYPIEEGIYPKIQAIRAAWHEIGARMNAILEAILKP